MPTHVALLRGINVGGRNRVAMAALREVVASLGHTDVATYIQSGNVVFTAARSDPGVLARQLEEAVAASLDVTPRVLVLTRAELAQVVRDNPYPEVADPRTLHAVLDDAGPDAHAAAYLDAARAQAATAGSEDRAQWVGRTLYLHTPDGIGRSRLAALLSRGPSSPMSRATARNWVTVTRLLALLDSAR